MNKKRFTIPLVILTSAELNDSGGGSNIGGVDSLKPMPMNFGEWAQSRFCADYDNNGGVDFVDYARWWAQCSLGSDTWSQYNPGVAWDDEWTK